jgi:hypothetical protein
MITRDIDKKYLWLLDIIKDVTDEYILEPSIKIGLTANINTNRYSVLIPNYQDFLIIVNRINKGAFFNHSIFNFIAHGMLVDADCIIGLDNNKIKIYMDYGKSIKAHIYEDNVVHFKEYLVLNDKFKSIALKFSYLFNIIDAPIDINNWRHVYKVTSTTTTMPSTTMPTIITPTTPVTPDTQEYHISLIIPIHWKGYTIYLLGITKSSITLYHR